jgi:hypothetical protein
MDTRYFCISTDQLKEQTLMVGLLKFKELIQQTQNPVSEPAHEPV